MSGSFSVCQETDRKMRTETNLLFFPPHFFCQFFGSVLHIENCWGSISSPKHEVCFASFLCIQLTRSVLERVTHFFAVMNAFVVNEHFRQADVNCERKVGEFHQRPIDGATLARSSRQRTRAAACECLHPPRCAIKMRIASTAAATPLRPREFRRNSFVTAVWNNRKSESRSRRGTNSGGTP